MQQAEYKKMFELEEEHFWFVGKRVYVQSMLLGIACKGPILDVGCGTGGMTKFLTKYGKVTGIDFHDEAIRLAKKRGINVVKGKLEELPFSNETFTTVSCFDVLYHKQVSDVERAVKEMGRVVKYGGWLVITDSAFTVLEGSHDVAMEGARRFRLSVLNKLLRREGFEIYRSRYIYSFLFLPLLLKRKFSKFRGNVESDVAGIPGIMNKVLLTIVRLESILLRYVPLPFGTSVLIVARKRSNG